MDVSQETKYCKEELEAIKNEYGQYIYESKDRKHALNLPYILYAYKEWLIENKIVKEIS